MVRLDFRLNGNVPMRRLEIQKEMVDSLMSYPHAPFLFFVCHSWEISVLDSKWIKRWIISVGGVVWKNLGRRTGVNAAHWRGWAKRWIHLARMDKAAISVSG